MTDPTAQAGKSALVGREVDSRYRVEELLGEGAVGAVYRATDLTSGRTVALKQWRSHTGSDEQSRGRFLREATALETLSHPNIVDVYGHGFVDGVPYVAMEHLSGQTLEDLLASGEPLPVPRAMDIARQMLKAIAFAHEHDVVHRDLKPENIFLLDQPDGKQQVKILDYGLAKFMSPGDDPKKGAQLTMTGMVMGTPLYMPPEQAAGSSVDLPVDVYAAGCVVFEMLSGRPPYLGESTMELLAAHMRAPIPQLADHRPDADVSAELQAFFDTALAKRQTQRFTDAGAMLAALNTLPSPPLKPRGAKAPTPTAAASQASTAGAPSAAPETRSRLGLLLLAALVLVAGALFLALR